MSEMLDARAQVIKLARLLEVDPQEIAFTEKIGTEGLREFRMQLVDRFYGQEEGNLRRFAKVGNLLPPSVIASLTKEAVGPMLAARIAGLVDPKQAVSVVSKLPVAFVADVAVQIDPRRVEPVIGRLPSKTVAALAIELVKRREYVTMGEFVGFADDSTLDALFAEASDSDLLQIAFVTDDKATLGAAIALLPDKRLRSIMRVAGRDKLWPEALDLLRHLPDDQYFRLIDLASQQKPETLDQLVAVTVSDDLWELVIPAIAQMADPTKVIDALLRADATAIKAFVDTVVEDGAWGDMRELLGKLPARQLDELRSRIARNGRAEQFEPVAELFAA